MHANTWPRRQEILPDWGSLGKVVMLRAKNAVKNDKEPLKHRSETISTCQEAKRLTNTMVTMVKKRIVYLFSVGPVGQNRGRTPDLPFLVGPYLPPTPV